MEKLKKSEKPDADINLFIRGIAVVAAAIAYAGNSPTAEGVVTRAKRIEAYLRGEDG